VAARNKLVAAGIEVGEFFHIGPEGRVSGLDPERRTYRSRALFSDPDGNVWLLQEITTRLPGRVDPGATSFGSASDLAARFGVRRPPTASTRSASAGRPNWPDWYAEYMVRGAVRRRA
jgi:hypothetical protein